MLTDMCMICKFAYQCHIGLLKSYRYFITYRDMIPLHLTSVRWSELLRLPYFDPIRFLTVDPMHCLFLGIAKWIVKKIWVDEGVLTPADLGRIPQKSTVKKVLLTSQQINGEYFLQYMQQRRFGNICQQLIERF